MVAFRVGINVPVLHPSSGYSWRLHNRETRAPAGSQLGAPDYNLRDSGG